MQNKCNRQRSQVTHVVLRMFPHVQDDQYCRHDGTKR